MRLLPFCSRLLASAILPFLCGAQSLTTIAVVNGATYERTELAPLTVAVAFGDFQGAQEASAYSMPVNSLGGVQVLVDQEPALLLYVSQRQVNFIVPRNVSPPAARIEVRLQQASKGAVEVPVTHRNPLLFLQGGSDQLGLILDSTGAVTSESRPVARGTEIRLYATGLGTDFNAEDFGVMIGLNHIRNTAVSAHPQIPGVWVIAIVLPQTGLEPGISPLALHAGGSGSNTVTLYVR